MSYLLLSLLVVKGFVKGLVGEDELGFHQGNSLIDIPGDWALLAIGRLNFRGLVTKVIALRGDAKVLDGTLLVTQRSCTHSQVHLVVSLVFRHPRPLHGRRRPKV